MTLSRIDIPQTPAPIRSTTATIDGVGQSARELGGQMELNHWNGYTFEHTMLILREFYLLQHHAPYLVDDPQSVGVAAG